MSLQFIMDGVWNDARMKLISIPWKMDRMPEHNRMQIIWVVAIQSRAAMTEYCTWEQPDDEYIAINTDGSLVGIQGKWRAVVRQSTGNVLKAVRGASSYDSINLVELHAV